MIPLVHVSRPVLVGSDVIAWAIVHAGTGYAVHRIDARHFATDTWLIRGRRWERDGRAYERIRIRRWKDRLPEAGALFTGGTSKAQIPPEAQGGLQRLVIETRRAELGHWSAMAAAPLFALWNPWPIAIVMVAYGIAVNAPFIAIQRYNRLRVSRLCGRRTARSRSSRGTTGSSIP